jgi:putative toxin-antitoxin system antitoxin component (TIGR02293 family)
MPGVFTHGDYRPLPVVGSHADEIVAFARTSGREAIVVVAGRLFARATAKGRHWPSPEGWDAAVTVTEFSAIRNVLAADRSMAGTELPVAELFDAVPIAVLQAQYEGVKRRPLASEETDKALRLARIVTRAESVFGDKTKAHGWLRKPKRVLNGATPLDYLASEAGARTVEEMLDRIDLGVLP